MSTLDLFLGAPRGPGFRPSCSWGYDVLADSIIYYAIQSGSIRDRVQRSYLIVWDKNLISSACVLHFPFPAKPRTGQMFNWFYWHGCHNLTHWFLFVFIIGTLMPSNLVTLFFVHFIICFTSVYLLMKTFWSLTILVLVWGILFPIGSLKWSFLV